MGDNSLNVTSGLWSYELSDINYKEGCCGPYGRLEALNSAA